MAGKNRKGETLPMKKLISAILVLILYCTVAPAEEPAPDMSDIPVGGVILFGHYEQDSNPDNGPEPIEWIVLDVQDGKALLLSRYGLDAKPYHEENQDITWKTCTLRNWLNSDFLNAAFSETEQRGILLTDVDNSDAQGYSGWITDSGNDTQDRLFLLSCAEAGTYLGAQYYKIGNANQNLKSRAIPTAYAKDQGSTTDSNYQTGEGEAAGWWWLRSPGRNQKYAAVIFFDGAFYSGGVNLSLPAVRPALWINLNSDIF